MKRVLRAGTVLSLLLFVATLAVWVHCNCGHTLVVMHNTPGRDESNYTVCSESDGLIITREHSLSMPVETPDPSDEAAQAQFRELAFGRRTRTDFLGFRFVGGKPWLVQRVDGHALWGYSSDLHVPIWFPLTITAIAPLAWAARALALRRQLHRRRMGLCPSCGYDLRATPGKCPECGAEPPAAGKAVPNAA